MKRRPVLRAGVAAAAALATLAGPRAARAQPVTPAMDATLRALAGGLLGDAPLATGGLRLELPALADNGHLVPVRLVADSPMTEADHVTRLVLLSPRNPVSRMAVFHLGPWSGRAEVASRIRLAGTQTVHALAELSGGRGWRHAQAEVVVTESACLDAG